VRNGVASSAQQSNASAEDRQLVADAMAAVRRKPASDAERARLLGVSATTYNRWKRGEVRALTDRNRVLLERYLTPLTGDDEAAAQEDVVWVALSALAAARRALDEAEEQLRQAARVRGGATASGDAARRHRQQLAEALGAEKEAPKAAATQGRSDRRGRQ
jgi:hypothetical protein